MRQPEGQGLHVEVVKFKRAVEKQLVQALPLFITQVWQVGLQGEQEDTPGIVVGAIKKNPGMQTEQEAGLLGEHL